VRQCGEIDVAVDNAATFAFAVFLGSPRSRLIADATLHVDGGGAV
jgi:hypothetical protein